MVFQDFDQISERRRLERQQKFRKRVTIAAVAVFALLVVVAAGVFAIISNNNHKQSQQQHSKSTQSQKPDNSEVSHLGKVIDNVCNATTYKETCHTSLKKAVEKDPSSAHPKDVLKLAIGSTEDEFARILEKVKSFKFESPREKAAFEDCKELIDDAKEELNKSISSAGGDTGKLLKNEADLNNWLSAVMSYQQTCIDGFPEGKLKSDMEKTFKEAKELTSNSLAMVSELTAFLTAFSVPKPSRRLLAKESNTSSFGEDGIPSWISPEDRRILKGSDGDKPTPNVTVAKDGSGQFKTISDALAAMPEKYQGRYVIYVKAGIYDETVTVTKNMVNVTIYGDGSQKSIVTGSKNFADGVQTFRTATFAALGDGFIAKAMGFRNTAGPQKHQAVAVRVQADRSIFLNCRFEGYQDTLYAQTHRQFYRSCVISGTIDFIFGDATAIFQNCLILVRKPMENQQNIVTAQGRIDSHETTGIVIQNCRIQPDKDLIPAKATVKSYLGRPWKDYSRTIVMESTIEDFIHPDGWLAWEGEKGLKTLYYAEFNNKGPGSKTDARVKWPGYHVIDQQEANKYTVKPFLQGDWITAAGAPVHFGLF
ncbi:putative pectinesterase/pectinesterase inhibitor 45 [Ricinus communis]|uniref:Pectinesterase n=1 Tax=Ricinus communis TaxID=3988 RepID=B9RR24_RICCO|nr:putative pectinesterase/pectinesterase inhibitor 45 [Ricinus communis]EEF46195.1 Pectinesterase-1 precursor, putative [Ricinus communis]|eukprot:XP_002516193.1 putative pectinesterase/pectinesterase inhibitor 45 [Ricinus communis]